MFERLIADARHLKRSDAQKLLEAKYALHLEEPLRKHRQRLELAVVRFEEKALNSMKTTCSKKDEELAQAFDTMQKEARQRIKEKSELLEGIMSKTTIRFELTLIKFREHVNSMRVFGNKE